MYGTYIYNITLLYMYNNVIIYNYTIHTII